MSAVHAMKTALLSTLLVASAFSGAAYAQEKERGPDGLYKEPTCDFDFSIKKALSKMSGKVPTGLKASNSKWDMEIYANAQDKSWTLVGKSKDPSATQGELCKLASSIDKPYDKEKWFAAYFTAPEADKPRIAVAPQEPKPNLN